MAACTLEGATEQILRHHSSPYRVFLGAGAKSQGKWFLKYSGCTGCGRRRDAVRTRVGGGEGSPCRTICGSPLCPVLWDSSFHHFNNTSIRQATSSHYNYFLDCMQGGILLALHLENTHSTGFVLVASHGHRSQSKIRSSHLIVSAQQIQGDALTYIELI
jgi:hypothetical protein